MVLLLATGVDGHSVACSWSAWVVYVSVMLAFLSSRISGLVSGLSMLVGLVVEGGILAGSFVIVGKRAWSNR
jgi:hypothetical protein